MKPGKGIYWENMSSHLIMVGHIPTSIDSFSKYYDENVDSIHAIWTSQTPGKFVHDLNEAFEFSGYQEGLALVLNDPDSLGSKFDESKKLSIIFVNDTLIKSHIGMLSTYVLNNFIRLSRTDSENFPRVTGLLMPDNFGLSKFLCEPGYLSSWIFMIEGMPEDLRRLSFYESNISLNNFNSDIYPSLPIEYKNSVNKWLCPTEFFKGWYQSIPGVELPLATLERKRFTIYLEHSMPKRFRSIGFRISSISQRLDLFSRAILSVLRMMDRVYGNFLKLHRRIFL